MFFYDPTIFLLLIGVVIAAYAQMKVSSTFRRYAQVESASRVPAWQVARNILDTNGLSDVRIEHIRGNLTDHYDPRSKVLRLSDTVYGSSSVAAVGVAAHEVGHAIQHDNGYLPLEIRNLLVPVANIGSSASWILIILGLILSLPSLLKIGCIAFAAIVVFQLVTLPVEFNASSRALIALEGGGYLAREEVAQSRKVLSAAAFTYVAAALVSILQLLRLVLLFGNRD